MRSTLAKLLTAAMEGIVLFLALFAAWPFGSVHAYFQWALLSGVAVLLGCWAARAILVGRLLWVACPVTVALAALCLLAIVQVLPLDADWIGRLSPATAELYDFLLPSPAEQAEAGADDGVRTLSLNAGATRTCIVQLVAILALFAVVRNNLRDPGAFYRLAWLAAINGVLLALVGMGQLASSPPNVVLWSFPTRGQVFGPFICRNHFAYYANLCLGLGAGLLLGTRYFLAPPRDGGRTAGRAWRDLFRDPRVLWLGTCLAILLAGLFACLSRGGVLGLAVGGGVALAVLRTHTRMPRWFMGAGITTLAGLLVLWIGFDRVSRRWEEVWQDNVAAEARTTVWRRTLPLVGRFPIWGTGLGTFGLAEPQMRRPGDRWNILHDHAHNDFLELWIEGGAGQLVVALVVIGLVVRQGMRAFRRHADTAMGRLALGALAGFVAVVVQSTVDFGLHIPAVALLAAVVAAMLANLAEVPERASASPLPRGLSPGALVQAAGLVAVGLFLVSAGARAEQAERYRLAARDVTGPRRVAYLRAAIALAPDHAELHVRLADALLEQDGDAAQARRHILRAWQLSPLSLDAQLRCARLASLAGDRRQEAAALERLRRLAPCDPGPWYAAGKQALADGDRAEGCRCWRNALLGGPTFLDAIVRSVPAALSIEELLDQVLPPDPALIVAAVDALAQTGLAASDEQRLLRAARDRLIEGPSEDHLLRARVCARLDDVAAACSAYEAVLADRPRSAELRLEFSAFLHRVGQDAEARRQLQMLLAQEPSNQTARDLHADVLRKSAERP
jgi:O-antigen ligase/tetratricopeptide (TPR) repeat protein